MRARLRRAAITACMLGLLYAAACLIGFALLVLAFKVGLLASIDILFYRGLVLIVLAFGATWGALAAALWRTRLRTLAVRDAFAAAVLSLALNLAFLIVVPVTVDRSISIFVLGQMAAHPDESFTPQAMSALFTSVYVDDHKQIDRRLREQATSGNVVKDGDGYRITGRGRAVIATARIVAALFDSHAGILPPDVPVNPPLRTAR